MTPRAYFGGSTLTQLTAAASRWPPRSEPDVGFDSESFPAGKQKTETEPKQCSDLEMEKNLIPAAVSKYVLSMDVADFFGYF